MKTLITLSFLFFSFQAITQNIVINGDFESHSHCPEWTGQMNGYLNYGYCPHLGTSDYLNACAIQPDPCVDNGRPGVPVNCLGTQEAYSGDAYIGLYMIDTWATTGGPGPYREYIVMPLSSVLEKDSIYEISFFVSKAETFGKATDAIMVAFSQDSIPIVTNTWAPLPLGGFKMTDYIIHDYVNWVKVERKYKANGTERFMTIGNFLSDEETTVEDSPFIPLTCPPGSIVFGNDLSSYYYIDNVSVEKSRQDTFLPNVFTPNGDGINDLFVSLIYGYEITIGIYNRWGGCVYQSENGVLKWDGTFNDKPCDEGVYFYNAILKDFTGKTTELHGNVSLMK